MKPFGNADRGKEGAAMAREKGWSFGESDRGVCMRHGGSVQ